MNKADCVFVIINKCSFEPFMCLDLVKRDLTVSLSGVKILRKYCIFRVPYVF